MERERNEIKNTEENKETVNEEKNGKKRMKNIENAELNWKKSRKRNNSRKIKIGSKKCMKRKKKTS